jgi:Ca2+-binding EF-hand superfamily protein
MKKKLIELFVNTIKMNRDCEVQKQIVNDMIEFEPYAVFSRIDRGERGCIDSKDVMMFLKDNGVKEGTKFFKLFMEYYDRDFDSVLSYEEFLNFILPEMNFLRTLTTQKVTFKIPFNEFLTDELENQLTGLFVKQAKLFNYINVKKLDFFLHDNPDLLDLFKCLDVDNDGMISFTDLDVFFRNHKLVLYKEEILSLIKLYDEDLDQVWNWNEFLFMILPFKDTYTYDTNKLRRLEDQYNRTYKGGNPFENNLRDYVKKSPLRYNPEMSSLTTNSRSPMRTILSPRREPLDAYNTYGTPKYGEPIEDLDRRKKGGLRSTRDDPLRYGYASPKREISPDEKVLIMKYDSPRGVYTDSMRYSSPRDYNYNYNSFDTGVYIQPQSSRTLRDPYEATKSILEKSGFSYREKEDTIIGHDSVFSGMNSKELEEPEVCCCCESEHGRVETDPYKRDTNYYECHCCDEREKVIDKYKTNIRSTGYPGGDTKVSEGIC